MSENSFKFRISTNMKYGTGESGKLGEEIKVFGCKKIAAVVDQGVFDHPQVIKTINNVKGEGISLDVYKNTSIEPDYDYLDSFTEQLRDKGYEAIVAIGGGSTLDLAKGVATLLTNPGPGLDYRGFPDLANNPLPLIAIPTTAGTGSEVTYNAVFTDSQQKKKLGINSFLNFPVLAIIDPLFTINAPQSVTVSAGADALVHTLESYVHKNHTVLSRMYSKEAFKLLFNNLWKVFDKPDDLEIRGSIALGAYLAGIALINAGSGPSGAFSYPLGAVYKVPHGYAGAMFISSITKLNVENGYGDYTELYDLIEGANRDLPVEEKNKEFAVKLQGLMDRLEVPRSLSIYGLSSKDIEFMIDQYDVLKAAIDQNPIEITKEDTREIMNALT
ncbi:iron-containing alcohol dehydrogenase [Candidatus Margulisiibacteriota bacterium]